MKKTWMSAVVVAIVAVTASGCAGGPEGATVMMPDGISLSPLVDNAVVSSADQNLPAPEGAALAPSADVANGSMVAIAGAGFCPVAGASSAAMETAPIMGSCVRGSLAADDAGQHFVFNPEAEVTYSMRFAGSGDATFDLGLVTTAAGGERTCEVFTAGLTSTRFSSRRADSTLCVVVHSESGAAQNFRLTVGH